MNPLDLLAAMNRLAEQWSEIVTTPPGLSGGVRPLVEQLRAAWPGASLYACLVSTRGQVPVVLGQNGRPYADLETRLAALRTPSPAEAADAWSKELSNSHGTAVVHPLSYKQDSFGMLALVLPPKAEELALARIFLESSARTLSLLLTRESHEALREEARFLNRLADKGELSSPLAHEFSNFLNVLLLQVSVLEAELPPEQSADLAEIRRQGNLAAELIGRFQMYSRGRTPPERTTDLNRVVNDAVEELRHDPSLPEDVELAFAPAAGSSLVYGSVPDVTRLTRFLIGNGMRAASQTGGKQVRISVEKLEKEVLLRVEDDGPSPSEEELAHLFETSPPNRRGVDTLELAACRSLVRHLKARIRAESRTAGSLSILVEFESGAAS